MSVAVAAFCATASCAFRVASWLAAFVRAVVTPAFALSNCAFGGTVPVLPDGLIVNFCGVVPAHVHSRVSWPLV